MSWTGLGTRHTISEHVSSLQGAYGTKAWTLGHPKAATKGLWLESELSQSKNPVSGCQAVLELKGVGLRF